MITLGTLLRGHAKLAAQAGIACVLVALATSPAHGAGFRQIKGEGVKLGVWYPSDTPTQRQRLGPFDTDIARNAPPRSGKFPIVLMSHGIGGRYRNHYLTAEALAEAGFVVIAPNHQADYLVDGPETAEALDHRYLELSLALDIVRDDDALGPVLSDGPVHAVGYSLGGATVLLAAGAGFSNDIWTRYCEENGDNDPGYCARRGFIFRFIQSFNHSPNLRPTSDPFRHPPLVTGRAVVVATAYQGIDVTSSLDLEHLTIIAFAYDTVTPPWFHSKPLRDALAEKLPVRLEILLGHHYAFIAPLPEWLTAIEDIPIPEEPEDFDRLAFIKQANTLIVDALTTEVE